VNTATVCKRQGCKVYLSLQKWSVGDVPLKANFLVKVNHPLARERMPGMRKETKYHAYAVQQENGGIRQTKLL